MKGCEKKRRRKRHSRNLLLRLRLCDLDVRAPRAAVVLPAAGVPPDGGEEEDATKHERRICREKSVSLGVVGESVRERDEKFMFSLSTGITVGYDGGGRGKAAEVSVPERERKQENRKKDARVRG
jgi:hypothetical protein